MHRSTAVDGFRLAYERPAQAAYSAASQADSILALIGELSLDRPILAGYDVGSRVAQAVAERAPQRVRALVLSPPLPGIGRRILEPEAQRQFWYQPFHQLAASVLERLGELYSRPGAFDASIAWYRAGAGAVAHSLADRAPQERLQVPTTVLWGGQDPLFDVDWSDRLEEFFAEVGLRTLPGVGHFVPVEAPDAVAEAIRAALP